MGLAASQARFLAITSRKMNCEFESMQIAQQKLSVTREQQAAAQDYQDSLSATKLVWDADNNCDGTGDIYNLSYGLLMTPSVLNEYDPYLITDTKGRIVLDNSMFKAAVAANVINSDGSPNGTFYVGKSDSTNDGSRNAFLYQLGVQNMADSSVIDSVKNLGDGGYSSKAGLGGEILDKTIAGIMSTNQFINYMKTATYNADTKDGAIAGTDGISTTSKVYTKNNNSITFKKDDPVYGLNIAYLFMDYTVDSDGKVTVPDGSFEETFCTTTTPNDREDSGKLIVSKNGQALGYDEIKKLTLGDFLSGKYTLTGVMDAKTMSTKSIAVLEAMAKLLGMGASGTDVKGLNVSDQTSTALTQAYQFSLLQLNTNYAKSVGTGGGNGKRVSNTISGANETNGIASSGDKYSSVSLTNMLKSFLTNFAIALDGYDSGFSVDKESTKNSKYVTDDLTYSFALKNETGIVRQDALNADFYNMLYNQLCMNGACTDETIREKVTDQNYLSHALKNGQLFVSMLNTDGYFYQGHYTSTAHIAEVTDDDAIAQAEAEYNLKKSKLNYKEQTLELKMKNIDTELSALTTEYDTVKNLISKNVEKVFTMFST